MRHHQPIELLRHQCAGLHNRCMKPSQSLFSLVSRHARCSRLRRSHVTPARLLFPRGFSSKRETCARSLNSKQIHVTGAKRGKMRASRPGLVLVEKVARILLTNHRAQQNKTKENVKLLSTLN